MSSEYLKLASDFPQVSNADWRAMVDKAIKGRDFEKVMNTKSYNGFNINGLYASDDVIPKEQPVSETQGWDICTPHWDSDAKATNRAILEDLSRGATSVGLRFQAGHFPGLKPSDIEAILAGVYPDLLSINLLPGEAFLDVEQAFLDYLVKAKSLNGKNIDGANIKGTFGIDPIGVLAQTGRLAQSIEDALKSAVAAALRTRISLPNMRAFNVSTACYHTAGASEAQELAIMLATAVTYLRAMEQEGISAEEAASHFQFTLVADADIYLTISKFRAARRLWAELLSHCGVKQHTMKLTAMSAIRMMSVRDPWVNILRATASCFAASVAGADEITLLPHDTMLGMPSNSARRIARNVQIVLQEESYLGQVIDPAAGSFAMEGITEDLTLAAWKEFQQIEKTGGIVEGLKIGSIQASLEDSWQTRRKNIARRKDAVTGISEFPDVHEKPITKVGPQPTYVMDAVEAGIEINPVAFHRYAEDFEALRDASDAYRDKSGSRPTIFMANLGVIADHTARATFAKNFFEAGGIESLPTKGFSDIAEMITAFKASGSCAAVICGTDQAYDDGAVEIIAALKGAGVKLVYLAGKSANMDALKDAGLTDCVFMGANLLDTLSFAMTTLTHTDEGEE